MGRPVTHFIMRFLVIASLIAITYSAELKRKGPIFSLVEERSSNGAPSIDVTFSDGYQDTLILNKYYANEVGACVAMTGCVGSEDLDLTILSTHSGDSAMFKWTKEGNVEIVDNSDVSKHGPRRKNMVDFTNRNIDAAEHVIPEIAAAEAESSKKCAATKSCSLPETQHLKIRVGYDDGILGHLKSASEVEKYIGKIWTHVQAYYCHSSLGSKVQVDRVGAITHIAGKNLKCEPSSAADASMNGIESTTKKLLGDAHLMLYFGFGGDGYTQGGGLAESAIVCTPKKYDHRKHSINCYGVSITAMASTLVHEIGHNLGMLHDMAADRPDKATDCDKTGFMSYEGNPNNQWSRCSKKDFTAYYNVYYKDIAPEFGDWCLKAAPKACDGVSAQPAPGPAPSPPPGPGPG